MSVSVEHRVPALGSYLTGFVLAVILTAIPFAVIAYGLLAAPAAVALVAVTAILQALVHLHFLLHLDFRRMHLGNLMTFGFAGFLIIVMIGGSLWIMFDLHYRMM